MVLAMLIANFAFVHAAPPTYVQQGTVNVAPSNPQLTAVDPMAYVVSTDVMPARPFLYSVDQNGLTITRFNDNKVVGTWPWPASVWIEKPDGSIMEIFAPYGGWGEPVGMTVSYPTETEIANRVKEIPDLTPPWTFVYVVMPHSGYQWNSSNGTLRDTLVPMTSSDTESSILLQINVNDPSFSTRNDPVAPVFPHIAGAILGHGAGQPVYDRKTGNVYVGNLPSNSLPANLASFVSVIHRIPPTVTAEEAEIPGLSKPVIRCGPQHPETGIPVGRPQAYACYDPSGLHPIDDNEHVGAFGQLKQWDPANPKLYQEQYVWEFRNLPIAPDSTTSWLTPHLDKVTGEPDGILYGTPPITGEWFAEARVHNLGDEYGVWSDWTPIRLLVTPSAEYLPIKAQFAAGVPVAYQLEGTGLCTLSGAPAWIDVKSVPNGCVVMGRAPISGEYYNFTMPGFRETGYPDIPIVFSGNVVGAYGFDPLPEGKGISGLAWHQVEKYQDPSTEPPVLTLEFIGVEPTTGQLYRILQPPGQPQPPNERPAETAIKIDTISAEGEPLTGSGFGQVAVEADRDIYVAATGAVIKVSGGTASTIDLGFTPSSLSLDSDLRTAIIGVEPGQVDNGVLWVAGTDNVAVIDTNAGTVLQTFPVPGASSVSVNPGALVDPYLAPLGTPNRLGTRYAYVAAGSSQMAIFGPEGSTLPPMEPRIWSSEEITWNRNFASIALGPFLVMATGDPIPTLTLLGTLPDGITFVDNGDGTATVSGTPVTEGEYAFAVLATNATGTYAQALGMSVNMPPTITSGNTATFTAGSASAFTVTGTGLPTPIFFTWDEEVLATAGVQLVDNENGTASLLGTPTTPGTYVFTINATTGCPPDATQTFTLIVNSPGNMAPTITSLNTVTWETVGAPFAPDPFTVTSIGSPTPALSVGPGLPLGVNFIDNGDGTATFGGGCQVVWPGMQPECLMALFEGTEGTYTFTITATNTAGTATQTFTLLLGTATSILTPPPTAPATLSFEYTKGGTTPATQFFEVGTLGDTMPYAAVTTAYWLEATTVSGWVPGTLNVFVDVVPYELGGMAAGTYTGTVLITSAGTDGPFATALVTLTVYDDPVVTVTPRILSFEYTLAGRTMPPAQTISLTSGGVPLNYTVSTDAAWLVATPPIGATPTNLSVSVNASKLKLGTYYATLTIDSAGGANGPQKIKIPVVLMKNATKTNFSIKVSDDVGSGPEGIAVNTKTHQVFIATGNEAAAEAATGSESEETALPEPVNPAVGNAVFRFDPSTGAVKGRILVHSEGEYIAVNSKTNRVYHASQRTSEIAVIDGLTDTIVGFIPLTQAEGAYMPYQIAVDEAQNLIYVGGHAPAIPDPIPVPGQPFTCKAIHEMPDDEYDCWNPGKVFVIDGKTNQVVSYFLAGDDPEGVVFAAATGKVYVSNEDDGSITVAKGAKRNRNGTITPPKVLSTIIRGVPVPGWWQPTCDANNYCGERGQAALWPNLSRCNGIDDEAEEADKMAVDPRGNVYIIDDRYRVAKIDGRTDKVVKVLEIEGFDCPVQDSDGSSVVVRNTANNIVFSAVGCGGTLFVTSEQDTVSLIDPNSMTLKQIITIPGAAELDAITTDPKLKNVYITDEGLGSLWILHMK